MSIQRAVTAAFPLPLSWWQEMADCESIEAEALPPIPTNESVVSFGCTFMPIKDERGLWTRPLEVYLKQEAELPSNVLEMDVSGKCDLLVQLKQSMMVLFCELLERPSQSTMERLVRCQRAMLAVASDFVRLQGMKKMEDHFRQLLS